MACIRSAIMVPQGDVAEPRGKADGVDVSIPVDLLAPELQGKLHLNTRVSLGYPGNLNPLPEGFQKWRCHLGRVGISTRGGFNNCGDPFQESHYPFNSHDLERSVIERFSSLLRFEGDGDTWGFVTNSGTESNQHGLYMGRTLLKHKTGRMPKLYHTAEAHYSMQILANVLGLDTVLVRTHSDGSMDTADLARCLSENEGPALVVASVGTTFKGAVDPISDIQAQLEGHDASYLHVDAASFGGYLPHTEFDHVLAQEVSRYDSIAISCHKFFGFPSPAGLYIVTREVKDAFDAVFSEVYSSEYIAQMPGTITCSRDPVKAAEFYFFSTEEDFVRQRMDAAEMLANTAYLHEQMRKRVPELAPRRANAMSNIVYFRAPSQAVISAWTLATSHVELDGESVPHAHVVIMPHVTKAILDQFVIDLALDTTAWKVSTQDSLTADVSLDVDLGTASDPFSADCAYDGAASEVSTQCEFSFSTESEEDDIRESLCVSEHTGAKLPNEYGNDAALL